MLELLIKLEVFLKRDKSTSKAIFRMILQQGVVGLMKENFMGNAKEYHDTLIRYEVLYRQWIVDLYRDKIRFRLPCNHLTKPLIRYLPFPRPSLDLCCMTASLPQQMSTSMPIQILIPILHLFFMRIVRVLMQERNSLLGQPVVGK